MTSNVAKPMSEAGTGLQLLKSPKGCLEVGAYLCLTVAHTWLIPVLAFYVAGCAGGFAGAAFQRIRLPWTAFLSSVADVKGNIYVGDAICGRVEKYDRDGVFQFAWKADVDGYLMLAADSTGSIYVLGQSRLRVFDSEGKVLYLVERPEGDAQRLAWTAQRNSAPTPAEDDHPTRLKTSVISPAKDGERLTFAPELLNAGISVSCGDDASYVLTDRGIFVHSPTQQVKLISPPPLTFFSLHLGMLTVLVAVAMICFVVLGLNSESKLRALQKSAWGRVWLISMALPVLLVVVASLFVLGLR